MIYSYYEGKNIDGYIIETSTRKTSDCSASCDDDKNCLAYEIRYDDSLQRGYVHC